MSRKEKKRARKASAVSTLESSARARDPLPWEKPFLAALREQPNLHRAASLVGRHVQSVTEHRERHHDFDAAVKEALAAGCGKLEEIAWDHAENGPPEVEGRHPPSPALMVTLLKAHLPEKYREKFQGSLELGGKADAPPVRIEAKDGDPAAFAAEVAAVLVEAGVIVAALPGGDGSAADEVHPAEADS